MKISKNINNKKNLITNLTEILAKQLHEYHTKTTVHNYNEVDSLSYEQLPKERKNENIIAAKLALDLVYDDFFNNTSKDEITFSKEKIEKYAEIIHQERIKRKEKKNAKKWRETQIKPYDKLTEDEKQKDRDQVLLAINLLKQENT